MVVYDGQLSKCLAGVSFIFFFSFSIPVNPFACEMQIVLIGQRLILIDVNLSTPYQIIPSSTVTKSIL